MGCAAKNDSCSFVSDLGLAVPVDQLESQHSQVFVYQLKSTFWHCIINSMRIHISIIVLVVLVKYIKF